LLLLRADGKVGGGLKVDHIVRLLGVERKKKKKQKKKKKKKKKKNKTKKTKANLQLPAVRLESSNCSHYSFHFQALYRKKIFVKIR
jgi:hypothetical protein